MFQTLVLFDSLPSSEWLAARADNRPFRATAEFTTGPFEGMGIISLEGSHHLHLRDLKPQLRGEGRRSWGPAARIGNRSLALALLPPLPPIPVIAHIPPDVEIVFALLEMAPGTTGSYMEELTGLADGLNVAAGRVFGDASASVALEIVGGSSGEVLDALGRLTDDNPSVVGRTLMTTTAELTTGFGTF